MENKKPENPFAFAYGIGTDNYDVQQQGMTLRDYIAISALNAALSNPTLKGSFGTSHKEENENLAGACYAIADSMLKQREL